MFEMRKIQVQELDHVALDVLDLEKAKTFYSELLGLQDIPRPESFDFPVVWYDLGNVVCTLSGRVNLHWENTT